MELNLLIEKASAIAGSQNKLAKLLGIHPPHIVEMKKGERACNWRMRGKLRAIIGEDPAHAFMAAMAEDLEHSENPAELQAAESLKAMLSAFPNAQEKSPVNPKINRASTSWRNRMFPTLHLRALQVVSALRDAVNSPLRHGHRNAVALAKLTVGHSPSPVLRHKLRLSF